MGRKKRQRGWLIPVTYIGVVLVASLLAVTWVPRCPVSLLMASASCFLPPLQDRVSRPRRVSSAHLAEMTLSKADKLLRQENLSQGILWPVPFQGTHRQNWQLSPRLEHGHVESIDQLALYHAQFNTPMEWHRQFCSSETRFD